MFLNPIPFVCLAASLLGVSPVTLSLLLLLRFDQAAAGAVYSVVTVAVHNTA